VSGSLLGIAALVACVGWLTHKPVLGIAGLQEKASAWQSWSQTRQAATYWYMQSQQRRKSAKPSGMYIAASCICKSAEVNQLRMELCARSPQMRKSLMMLYKLR